MLYIRNFKKIQKANFKVEEIIAYQYYLILKNKIIFMIV